ncbi:MAG TPA: hypothetical protein VNQ76_08445 [Planctomicrobium sp.]|nr:hypothetical protein [Planctomicrobium sp.]
MTEQQVKELFAELLQRYSTGSLLHLLADLYRQAADEAQLSHDSAAYEQCKVVEHALLVLGLGIDAVNPS